VVHARLGCTIFSFELYSASENQYAGRSYVTGGSFVQLLIP
jgi:hypothetical protein